MFIDSLLISFTATDPTADRIFGTFITPRVPPLIRAVLNLNCSVLQNWGSDLTPQRVYSLLRHGKFVWLAGLSPEQTPKHRHSQAGLFCLYRQIQNCSDPPFFFRIIYIIEFHWRNARIDRGVRTNQDLPFSDLFPYLEQRGSSSFNKALKLLALNTMREKNMHSHKPQQ